MLQSGKHDILQFRLHYRNADVTSSTPAIERVLVGSTLENIDKGSKLKRKYFRIPLEAQDSPGEVSLHNFQLHINMSALQLRYKRDVKYSMLYEVHYI